MKPLNEKILGIEIVRGLSAILVMLFHYTSRYNEMQYVAKHDPWSINVFWGYYAVIAFFFITGFLSATNIEKYTPPILFLKKRINRLYPTFWVAMIMTYVATTTCKIGEVGWDDFIVNFTMLPALFGRKPVDGVYWTLQYEFLYSIVITILLSVRKRNCINVFLFIWVLASIISAIYDESSSLITKAVRVFAMVDYCPVFVLGLAAGLIMNRKMALRLYMLIATLSFVAFYLWKGLEQTFFLLVICSVMIFISREKTSWLNKRNVITNVFIWVASISYPLYLIHQKIGYIVMSYVIENFAIDDEWIVLFPISLCVVIAFLLHKYVERNRNLYIFKT